MINELEINEKILVCNLKNGEVEAFDLLFRKYYEKLFQFSLSLLKNKEDARDIVQDAFYKIWEARCQLDASKSFKSFLFTISYHLIIDQLRVRLKDQTYRKYLEDTFGLLLSIQDNQMDFQNLEREINHIVEELPEKRKEIYYMSRKKGLSHKKIAALLGISSKTVENQITLSLKYIKSRLGKEMAL